VTDRLRAWAPDATVGLAVMVVGLVEVWSMTVPFDHSRVEYVLVVLGFAAASGLSRLAPFAALALVWATCSMQLVAGTPVFTVEFAIAIVAFGCARWGHPFTVFVSGISIPAAAAVGYVIVTQASMGIFRDLSVFRELRDSAERFSDTLAVGATILGLLVLAVPWLAGLVLRSTARARRSEVSQVAAEEDAARAQRETEQAREIAQLRDEQATMARDVHDVVGHSLAVILAQAESAQFLPDADTEALKRTMATIATSARSSLQDVRQVLAGPQHPAPARPGGFDQLLDGVRASGHEVVATEVGAPQPLPPDLEVVAFRVAQEMLTNAIKHGRRDAPVQVERHWPEGAWDRDLRIEVRNVEERTLDETRPIQHLTSADSQDLGVDQVPGQGLDGMRRRLDSVGGRLDVRRREDADGPTFTATAWVPIRVGSR
jgi:signal transduction histidine kinase